MKKLLTALFATCAFAASTTTHGAPPRLLTNTTPSSLAIWLGSPTQPYREGAIIQQAVTVNQNDVIMFTAEALGTIYNYPATPPTPLTYVMFQTSIVYVFAPGYVPPAIHTLGQPWPGGTQLSPQIGMDIGLPLYNYYMPVVRSGAYKAPVAGTYTFVLYMWGGSSQAGSGNAATVSAGTTKMTLVVIPAL